MKEGQKTEEKKQGATASTNENTTQLTEKTVSKLSLMPEDVVFLPTDLVQSYKELETERLALRRQLESTNQLLINYAKGMANPEVQQKNSHKVVKTPDFNVREAVGCLQEARKNIELMIALRNDKRRDINDLYSSRHMRYYSQDRKVVHQIESKEEKQ